MIKNLASNPTLLNLFLPYLAVQLQMADNALRARIRNNAVARDLFLIGAMVSFTKTLSPAEVA